TATTDTPGERGRVAVDLSVSLLERLANGARHREARDRHRVAPPGLSPVLDVEESPPRGSTNCRSRCPHPDSDHSARQSSVGSATDSRRAAEVGTRSVSVHGREIHAAPIYAALANLAHIPGESRAPDRRRRLLRGTDRHLPTVICIGAPRPRAPPRRAH